MIDDILSKLSPFFDFIEKYCLLIGIGAAIIALYLLAKGLGILK
jgi:hypothetical protein